MLNIIAAWVGMLLGCIAGAVQGLFFHKQDWLGGYGSWRRRITRLGHISFFGLGFINLAFALTVKTLDLEGGTEISSYLLVLGLITMPLFCYLSALKEVFRQLFFIPTASVLIAIILLLLRLFQS